MKINQANIDKDETKLQMTSMIDIVFQLLIFFILTFNVVQSEGDFQVLMPARGAEVPRFDKIEPKSITIRLEAISAGEQEGELEKLTWVTPSGSETLFQGGSVRGAFHELHKRVRREVEKAGGPKLAAQNLEFEFSCDYKLKYDYVIKAISAVVGDRPSTNHDVEQWIKKIRLAPIQKSD